ncbi:MAG: helix-turn-helix transcriptional regulator [Synergistaceae bacterium]|jgi:transcriptional regulator with XRE-family HTH domain|nr:helix-turn-helix transcriptional regulator [Synergistaceae bacterium]MDD3516180.1 helix-turn-helix transcriptional regulator [Synergistaceae bacterium]
MPCGRDSLDIQVPDIRKLRQDMDCTQEEFCRALGVTVAALSRWETGKSRPRGKNLEMLAFLQKRLNRGASPEKLKKILLLGSVLAGPGLSPVALMASGMLSEDFIRKAMNELFADKRSKE